jgi:hypothetical protein
MSIDPYALCPCGSGKKLKFCCSDLVGEIEKIHRMIEGDQPRAALRHVEHTLAAHPGRASLLDLKGSLELSLGEMDEARRTVETFVQAHSDSPTAHASQAMWLAESGEARAAAAALQRALALVDRDMPLRVYEAMGAVGGALLEAGHILAAQAHLWLHAALAPREDTRSREVLAALHHYSGLPLLLRDQIRLRPWPADVPWSAEAREATRLAEQGKWQPAVDIVDRLGQRYGAEPVLVFNRALLGGWLGDDRALVAGLHAYAQLDVPLQDAIEAEAVAQLLDPDQKEPRLDSLLQTYAIRDMDALVSNLLSDRRVQPFELDPAAFAHSDQPRPRQACVLLDRPMPEPGAELRREDVPRLAGVLALFGRQTDRAERLELTIDRGPKFAPAVQALKEIGAEALGAMSDERVVGSVSATDEALNWRWQMPPGTPPEVRRRLAEEERRAAITERWPELPRPALGGKTPREAAGEDQLQISLMAAVLNLEQGAGALRDADAIAQLRDQLGLPQPGPIELADEPAASFPLVRVPRLKTEALSDDGLVVLYSRSVLVDASAAIAVLAREVVQRPSLAERIPRRDVYRRLVAAETDPGQALALIHAAREQTRSAGESTAPWDLAELELYIRSGDVDEAKLAMARIEREHRDDPDVAAALYRLLYETGAIPDELPEQDAGYDELPAAVVDSPEPAASRIWTPDSDRPAGGKSPIWTPS